MKTRWSYIWLLVYLFILCIEILALGLKNSKAKPYQTQKGNKHPQEQYANDLPIFLEYVDGEDDLNALNIKNILKVFNDFFCVIRRRGQQNQDNAITDCE